MFVKKYNIPYEGKIWSKTDLAEHLGVRYNILNHRLKSGWPPERWGGAASDLKEETA